MKIRARPPAKLIRPNIRMGESDFKHCMDFGIRWAGLSVSDDLLRFSYTIFSEVYREWYKREKISSEQWFSGGKCLVYVRGQKRMARLL